jgi:hypothetical protein
MRSIQTLGDDSDEELLVRMVGDVAPQRSVREVLSDWKASSLRRITG